MLLECVMVKKLLMSSALMVLMGSTLSPLKAEGVGPKSLEEQARKIIGMKLKSVLEQDPQDMEPVLDAMSIKKGDERLFPTGGALGPIFSELLESDVREAALKLLDWANQDPAEASHQAVLGGFLNSLLTEVGSKHAWAFFKDGHILGSPTYPEHLRGSHYIFRPQDLMNAGFTNATLLFGRATYGQSEIFPKDELTKLFTTSILPEFTLQRYTPEHKEEFETLFPLSAASGTPCWPVLEKLSIHNSRLGVDEARHLATFLESSNVKSVNLWGIVDSNSAIVSFTSNLSPHTKVQNIELIGSRLSDEDVIEIGKRLPPTVHSIDLKDNYIRDEGINGFLENVKGKNLQILTLKNNRLSDGARLARSLHGTKIRLIDISGIFNTDAIKAFAQNLPDAVLQVDLGEDLGEDSLKDTLKAKYPKIEWL